MYDISNNFDDIFGLSSLLDLRDGSCLRGMVLTGSYVNRTIFLEEGGLRKKLR
jgi:hypothetical protein